MNILQPTCSTGEYWMMFSIVSIFMIPGRLENSTNEPLKTSNQDCGRLYAHDLPITVYIWLVVQ